MYKYLFIIWFVAGCSFVALAQKPDTTVAVKKNKSDTLEATKQDTAAARLFKPNNKKKNEKAFHPDSLHSPAKAIKRSLLIPGWGQVYNHQWFLVPVIYTGLGLIAWAFVYNNNYYQEFLTLSIYREHGIVPTSTQKYFKEYNSYINVPDQAIYDANDGYRRDRDLSILGFIGAWGINVIDAYVEAKFQSVYTVDNNFTLKITPGLLNHSQASFAQIGNSSLIPGLKFTFTLK